MYFELKFKVCRICLKSSSKKLRTFCSDSNEISQIFLISSVKIENEAILICQNCQKRLRDAIKLRNDCIKAAKHFDSLFGKSSIYDSLEKAQTTIKKKKKYQCTKCCKFFSCIYYLKQHEIAIHTELTQDKFFACDRCEFKSKTKALMRTHQINNHFNLEEKSSAKFQCKFCGRISNSIGALFAHEKTHKQVPIEDYKKCEYCSKSFREQRLVKSHIELVHKKSRARQCNQCGHVATCSGSLKKHVKALHLKLKDYVCSECQQTFCTNQQLIRHERSHRGEKPYKCEKCNKNFADAHGRKRHYEVCSIK